MPGGGYTINNERSLSTPADIEKFSCDYLVDERLVRDYVTYLDNLKLKSDKRKAETRRRKERSAVAAAVWHFQCFGHRVSQLAQLAPPCPTPPVNGLHAE